MQKKKKTTKILDGLLGLSVLALLGFGAWYLYDSNTSDNQVSLGELIATNTPTPKQAGVNVVNNDEQTQTDRTRVSSGQEAYSIEVPNGWEVTRDTSSDTLFIDKSGVTTENEASVVDIDVLGSEQRYLVAFQISETGPDEPSTGEVSDFSAGDLSGKKYSPTEADPEGRTSTEYYFAIGDQFIQALYSSELGAEESSSPDELEEVEAMIRSLEL